MSCHVCLRTDVRKRPRSGKKHYPHKCPHGVWCVTGHPLLGHHANNVPVAGPNCCDECGAVHREKRLKQEERRADDEYFRSGTRYPGQ